MIRYAVVLSAAVVVLVTGILHGTLTQRFSGSSEDLDAAVGRLDNIPLKVGPWSASEAEPIEQQDLQAAGASGSWVRSFTSAETGQKVQVILLCGRTGKMCVHRPENCYPAQGFDLTGTQQHQNIKLADGAPDAEFWTARFAKPDITTGGEQLRIYWTWNAGGQWKAPEYPRWTCAALPYLYKLYVIRSLPIGGERQAADPAEDFLRQFLPELNKALTPS
jgi:hypothetical protein